MVKSRENALKLSGQADRGKFILPAVLFVFMLLVMFYWRNTWDDSAITLAFSRNLAKYGDIIPSEFSDRVEGYSTFLWMIINASFFRLGLDERTVIVVAKSISTVLSLLNILMFWQLVKKNISQLFYRTIILFLFTINLQTVTSATFGMETSLYAFLVLVSYILYKKRDQSRLLYIGFTFTSSLLILIRHEGTLFLIPFVIESLREKPKSFYKELFLYFWVGVFLVYHVWHFAYFGELLTNPMIAKRQPPYVPDLNSSVLWVIYYLFPFFRAITVYPILFTLLGFNLIFLRGQGRQKKPKDPLMLGIALTGMFIMLITGMSWNADADRLSYPALAFLLLSIAQYLDGFPIKDVMQKSRIVFTVIFGVVLIVNVASTFRTFTADQRFHITVSEVEKGARFETLVQEYLGLSRMTLASPDMGGLLLFYGDGKRIIDLGLLCNRELAQKGYQLVDSYVLTKEKPELIEIHDVWAIPFSDSELFYENYTPAQIVEGNERWFVFLRNDLIHKLEGQANASKVKIEDGVGLRAEIAFLLEKYDYFWKITFAN